MDPEVIYGQTDDCRYGIINCAHSFLADFGQLQSGACIRYTYFEARLLDIVKSSKLEGAQDGGSIEDPEIDSTYQIEK